MWTIIVFELGCLGAAISASWREGVNTLSVSAAGYCGDIWGTDLMAEVHDDTKPDGSYPALVG